MLPKINRIKKKKDFELIFKKARSLKHKFLILKIARNNLNLNRFGFVVSLKVSKRAVVRNKIRRRLSESIKAEEKNIKIGTDAVLIALAGIEKQEFSEIKEMVYGALYKASAITKQ